ncbi:YigZ family protein [Paucilactobacillus wasatchensis]|uniref:YigZ family protein n=1 Tax=Paucilactobacillus wasatchensis TaxID=1335616 RepID=A0A0D0YUI6_9LACO|nr:YigZ family protein [Paucilactobacillus wasatchensis]KIS02929.1 hypothetical protein WDC_1473 [Paucilactobacillus wasatchensis]
MPYLTIAQNFNHEQTIKKSRFICSLARVTDETAAQNFIKNISNQEHKANHHCFAYQLGPHDEIQRESDDGEPSGTAGVPILQSLRLLQVHDVVAVVTRYFGGIKLGAGGLIRAYSNTTSDAIHAAGLIAIIKQTTLQLTIAYADHDSLNYFLQQNTIKIADEQYGVNVTISIFVDQDQIDTTKAKIINLLQNRVTISLGDTHFNEVPYPIK